MPLRHRLLPLLGLVLTGCAGLPTVSYVDPTNRPDLLEIGSALNGQVTLVTVTGTGFPGLPPAQMAAILAEAMPTGFLNNARFTADPAAATQGLYHVVWNFGVPTTLPGDAGCAAPIAPHQAPAAWPLGMHASLRGSVVFCRAGGPYTQAYGYVDDVAGPGDPKLKDWVVQMSLHILTRDAMPPGMEGGAFRSSRPRQR
jgi:hypothetical protein